MPEANLQSPQTDIHHCWYLFLRTKINQNYQIIHERSQTHVNNVEREIS